MGSRHRPGIGSNELKGGKKSMPWNIARFDDSTKSLRTARRWWLGGARQLASRPASQSEYLLLANLFPELCQLAVHFFPRPLISCKVFPGRVPLAWFCAVPRNIRPEIFLVPSFPPIKT
ncbi:conserved hypothetical protein [Coccidioides posadasii str. Silveira]|uniref:Uncharacterized protein n=2 Tax=Coccidioides posadasii TaxID=199306 RepID=E9CVU0_COCPS|nr:conserved hypothetical protein [Coccidioides posadasii str. Silveira]KMM64890.1 hypothetical protein CPAG_01242 [Coccidioides posadasii RMSCC 3488]